MNYKSLVTSAALFCAVPFVNITAAHYTKKLDSIDVQAKDEAIIGSFDQKVFILNNNDSVCYKPERGSYGTIRNWKIGNVIRAKLIKNSSLYELKNITTGQTVKALAIPLNQLEYKTGQVGTLSLLKSKKNDMLLADNNHYVSITPNKVPQKDWKNGDVIDISKKSDLENIFLLKNQRSGAVLYTRMVPAS